MNKPISYDMTFCTSDCDNEKCIRNFKYLVKPYDKVFYSLAELRGTEYCMESKEECDDQRTT